MRKPRRHAGTPAPAATRRRRCADGAGRQQRLPLAGRSRPHPHAGAPAPAPATACRSARRRSSTKSAPASAQGSAEPGTIVWSLVQESPGGDLPPEPAIRAEATIPGKDIQLRMTIRRNADQTLPASHIIEMIFLTPDGFEGGGIDNILRVAMKGSEQDAGSPLIGIPAKIADGFFLVALNDTKAEIDANMALLAARAGSTCRWSTNRAAARCSHGKGHSGREGVRRSAEGLAGG